MLQSLRLQIALFRCHMPCNNYYVTLFSHHLQLGSGTAVPGITAAKLGAQLTTLTDRGNSPRLIEALQRTCELNSVPQSCVQVMPLSWGVFSPQLLGLEPQDLILASDCFYNTAGKTTPPNQDNLSKCPDQLGTPPMLFPIDFEDILVTVHYLMEKNTNCKFWTSYQERRYVFMYYKPSWNTANL